MGIRLVSLALGQFALAGLVSAETAAKVDFGRDVLPLLKQNCIGCHGPAQQNAGLRLDRKSSVLAHRGIIPGTSSTSTIYQRIVGSEYGTQMPPTGALRPEQMATIKAWIDQGAEWPDSLSAEVELPPLNPKAVALVETLRSGDMASFMEKVAAAPKLLNERGPDGATPFMYAVLYSEAATIAKLLKQGGDPKRHNDANATALMWAASDLEKTRLLLDHGADVNARSDDMRTPLMIAARRPGGSAVVKLLLDRGANPNPNPHPVSESSPLIEAANAGDAASIDLLLRRGADAKASAQAALTLAATVRCSKCVDLLAAKDLDKAAYTGTLAEIAVLGDLKSVKLMVERGADVNAYDPTGRTPLMYAVRSDRFPLDVVKLLVDHGADINAKDRHSNSGDAGLTVLDLARQQGQTPIVDFLVKAGAKGTDRPVHTVKTRRDNTVAAAVQASIPLLQRSDAAFMPKASCASCHNNSIAAMAVSAARKSGIRVDEKIAAQQVKMNAFGLQVLRNKLYQSAMVPVGDFFGPTVLSYMLLGLDAERYPADLNTDAVAMYLKMHQMPDGQWAFPVADTRPPLCSNYISQTAMSMRALQLYAPKTDKAAYDKAIRMAAAWLAKAQPHVNDDRAWRLMGLAWAGIDKDATAQALRELLAAQRPDGGWSDIETRATTPYATGQALVALHIAGVPATDKAYERGIRYLLNTQEEDGSWYVRTRALGFQPYFDAEFPHGHDQWISSAASGWATIALAVSSPAQTTADARVR